MALMTGVQFFVAQLFTPDRPAEVTMASSQVLESASGSYHHVRSPQSRCVLSMSLRYWPSPREVVRES